MTAKQILEVAKAASYARGVDQEVIFEAIESSLEIVTKKRYLSNIDVKVIIDRATGDYTTHRYWTVVPDQVDGEEFEFDSNCHIRLSDAIKQDPNLKVDDKIEELVSSIDFGRIAAQTAKQVIMQKVRDAKRAEVVNLFVDKIGQMFGGVIKKISREGIILDLGNNAEAFIPKTEMLPNESSRVGDRIRSVLYDIKPDARGPQLLASRTCKEMLSELFKIEVPEVGEEVIEIKAVARDAGFRSKVAVKTNDGRIDPIGACVGMRGSRIQVISNELCGERIDVILWDDSPAQLVLNALKPAEIASILMDESSHSMDIAVDPNYLSQAIGRNGQNVRLASELTGWTLNILSTDDAEKKTQEEMEKIKGLFIDILDVDEALAGILAREGFTSLEEVAYVPRQELESIEEFDDEIIEELRNRARDILTNQETSTLPSQDLVMMKGMTSDMAKLLASNSIKTSHDLADLSVDDLLDIVPEMTSEHAGELIMTARESWFK